MVEDERAYSKMIRMEVVHGRVSARTKRSRQVKDEDEEKEEEEVEGPQQEYINCGQDMVTS